MNMLLNRLYSDYLMPSRLAEYEALLARAAQCGYRQLSVRDFHRAVRRQGTAMGKVLVHRHDIDGDVRTARKMFALETKHDAKAGYYFRLSTLDYGSMRNIEAGGSLAEEVVWHT